MSTFQDQQVRSDGVERANLERNIHGTVIAAGMVERADRNAPAEAFQPVVVKLIPEE